MPITKNTLVSLDYRLTDDTGELLNTDGEPLIYLHGGYGHIFAKVEEALEGRDAGDSVRVELSPAEAFGKYDDDLVVEEDLSELPEGLETGMEIEGSLEESPDEAIIYTVAAIRGDTAVLDANHPLSGKALLFEGTVLKTQQLDEKGVREILEHHH